MLLIGWLFMSFGLFEESTYGVFGREVRDREAHECRGIAVLERWTDGFPLLIQTQNLEVSATCPDSIPYLQAYYKVYSMRSFTFDQAHPRSDRVLLSVLNNAFLSATRRYHVGIHIVKEAVLFSRTSLPYRY